MSDVRILDVLVIGGGHAGAEAAHAAARTGARTALVTLQEAAIGVMSCNPAIGGLGRGHIVREIDALDGIMARAIDQGGIQFRLLNRRKGPAVQGPRAQADRELYRMAVQRLIQAQKDLEIVAGEAVELDIQAGQVRGAVDQLGRNWRAGAVVLTTGTFLRGMIYRGDERIPAGRLGDAASVRLSKSLESCDFRLGRLKTGTPPRLDRSTIDWDAIESQLGDSDPQPFSFMTEAIEQSQISCGIAYTNERSHDLIGKHLLESPTYSGAIGGTGVRYCPSIEDKIVRFPDRQRHQIFLEPEGYESDLVYPNGISTALPSHVQTLLVNSIQGLERCRIVTPGYAIEYDFIDPRGLDRTLAVKSTKGLYLAGQINGTTGYEEAAGQGVVAGANAALFASGSARELILDRGNSYIGVMIDDITQRGVIEPYRMLTSRAEFRISLRAANSDFRLTPIGMKLGLVGCDRSRRFTDKWLSYLNAKKRLSSTTLSASALHGMGADVKEDGSVRNLLSWLEHPAIAYGWLAQRFENMDVADPLVAQEIDVEAKYAPYLVRQAQEIENYRRESALQLSETIDYQRISGLSRELVELLSSRRPQTIEAAARLSGMTPAALSLLYRYVKAA